MPSCGATKSSGRKTYDHQPLDALGWTARRGDGELSLPELLDGASKSKEFQDRLRVMDIDQALELSHRWHQAGEC